jgi:hypothetical protein
MTFVLLSPGRSGHLDSPRVPTRYGEMSAGGDPGLVMHGISRPVTFTVSGRRDRPSLQVAGSILHRRLPAAQRRS